MTYEKVKNLKEEEFKRLCGVKIETFAQMVKLVRNQENLKTKSGRPSKLSIENQVLMTLEYLREYRTYFHIGQSWGINESTVFRIVRKVEEILIQAKEFRLPGKKQLLNSEENREIIVVDVTETPREKPKKTEKLLQWKKEKAYIKSSDNCRAKNSKNYMYSLCERERT